MNWKIFGQMVAMFVDLCKLVRDTFTKQGVGLESVPWVLGEGRAFFVEWVEALGQEILKTQRVRRIDDCTIEVNLGVSPILPFEKAEVSWHQDEGFVPIQKRAVGLYVGDKQVVLYRSTRQQKSGAIDLSELHEELKRKLVLNANILDALIERPHLIPEAWKKVNTCFWGTGFRNQHGVLYVRYLVWRHNKWCADILVLAGVTSARCPAACLEA